MCIRIRVTRDTFTVNTISRLLLTAIDGLLLGNVSPHRHVETVP